MIPIPRAPGDLPLPPEEPVPVVRSAEPTSLVLHALEDIEELKRTIEALTKRLEGLEHRVAGLEKPTA